MLWRSSPQRRGSLLRLDLSAFPALLAFQKRVGERLAVREALAAEAPVKKAHA